MAFLIDWERRMDTNAKPPEFEDLYRRYEFAPLVEVALVAADWLMEHRVDGLAKRQPRSDTAKSGEARTFH